MYNYNCPDCNEAKLQSDKNARKINEVIDQVNNLIQVNNETVDFIEEKANEKVGEIAEIKVNEVLGDLSTDIDYIKSSLDNIMSKFNYVSSGKTMVFAHRGVENLAPENTIISIEYAGQLGFDGVEIDIQDTLDGEWVLMHDDTVDRTTNGVGQIKDMTLSQIKALNIDYAPYISRYPNLKVPTFEEVIQVCKKWNLKMLVEIKKIGNHDNLIKIVETIYNNSASDLVIILAPIDACLLMKSIAPNLEYGGFLNSMNDIDVALPLLPLAHVSLQYNQIDKNGIELAHSKGFKVGAWILNYTDTLKAQELKSWGVDYITGVVL